MVCSLQPCFSVHKLDKVMFQYHVLSGIHLYFSCFDSMHELVQWPHGRKKSSLEVEHSLTLFVQQHLHSKHTIQNQPLSSCTAYDSTLFPVVLWLQWSIGFYTMLLPLLHWYVHFSCPDAGHWFFYYFVLCVHSAFLIRWILLTTPAPSYTTACQTWADTNLLHKCCCS